MPKFCIPNSENNLYSLIGIHYIQTVFIQNETRLCGPRLETALAFTERRLNIIIIEHRLTGGRLCSSRLYGMPERSPPEIDG